MHRTTKRAEVPSSKISDHDLQEKLVPAQSRPDELLKRGGILLGGTRALEIPVLAAQQYPKGLGLIVPEVKKLFPENTFAADKITFSCFGTQEFRVAAEKLQRQQT